MYDGFGANYFQESNQETWEVEIDGRYSTIIKNYLISDGIPEESADKIICNAAKTLSYGPNPNSTDICKKTGIVIGKVQSGKTSNFITLTSLAFDNGYNLIVVLGGTKKVLVKQNRDRIKEYFKGTNDVLVLDTESLLSEITASHIHQFIKSGKKIVIVSLKTPQKIKYIKDNVFHASSLASKPTLIIDDEGDEASLNTLVYKNKKSATYSAIEELKDVLERHSFISVTATPQANMLIDTLDVLSPDFGVLVDPGDGYCGLNAFHSDNKYIVEIPEKEESLLDADGVPESFIDALSMFFVSCAIQKYRGLSQGDKVSMLVHPSQRIIDHKFVFKKIDRLINEWIEMSADKGDIAYDDIKTILVRAYNNYANTTVENIPQFSEIEDEIINAINTCGKHIVNGESVSNDADSLYDYNIYLGGALLGRGLTLKGLTITYIIRTAKGVSAADTVQQRARWFGYKKKYLDLCRVFAVSKILNEFRDIREHEEDLWETVREANLQGTKFKSITRIFVLSDNLRMTRQSVARAESFTYSFWNKQKYFQRDANFIQSNKNIIDKFKQNNMPSLRVEQYGNGAPYSIISSDFKSVYNHILKLFMFPENSKLNSAMLLKFAQLLEKKGINPVTEVIWMRDDVNQPSEHAVFADGRIPNYSVGRRPQDLTKQVTYMGDDYQFKKDGVVQLQIHIIKDKISNIVSPTLALYIPIDVVEHLTNLVIKS